MKPRLIVVFLLFLASLASAQSPHEVLLLVNANSQDSHTVANHYVALRGIPRQNLIYLDLPKKALTPQSQFTPAEFEEHIWTPAQHVLSERGLTHIVAWVYSAGFPTRISSNPKTSLTGITFARNQLPKGELIKAGRAGSALFAGPMKPNGPLRASYSLDQSKRLSTGPIGLPSMMLTHTGSRGLTVPHSLDLIERSVKADRTRPKGTFYYYLKPLDVRTKCRLWQIEGALTEFNTMGIEAKQLEGKVRDLPDGMGAFLGQPHIAPSAFIKLQPGSMGEHLTSFGAFFDNHDQTKCTDWLRAGATATAGTVTEPFAIWTKFPHARHHVHYARGCTMLESFYQSVFCPYQLLILGDPLCRPWARPMRVTCIPFQTGPLSGVAEFNISTFPMANPATSRYRFLVDGKLQPNLTNQPKLKLDTGALSDGFHDLYVSVLSGQPVANNQYDQVGFDVNNQGRSVSLDGVQDRAEVDLSRPLPITVKGLGDPTEIRIEVNGHLATVAKGKGPASVSINLKPFGTGPVRLSAVGLYKDGMTVRSKPVLVEIKDLNQPPVLQHLSKSGTGLVPTFKDPENQPAHAKWFQSIFPIDPQDAFNPQKAKVTTTPRHIEFAPNQATTSFLLSNAEVRDLQSLTLSFMLPSDSAWVKGKSPGLVFGFKDEKNYGVLAMNGDQSGWDLTFIRQGKVAQQDRRGAFIHPRLWHELRIVRGERGGVLAYADESEMTLPVKTSDWDGRVGVITGDHVTWFKDARIHPPQQVLSGAQQVKNDCRFSSAKDLDYDFTLRLSDGQAFTDIRLPKREILKKLK